MQDPIVSISTIRNFMGNAGRNTCNEYLYRALMDADEALQMQIAKEVIENNSVSTKTSKDTVMTHLENMVLLEKTLMIAEVWNPSNVS